MSDAAPETGDPGAPESETQPGTSPDQPAPDVGSLTAERDKWKALSKQNETQAKAATKELETLRRNAMSDQERAIAEARAEATAEAAQLYGGRLVDAEVRAQAKGRVADVDALLEGIDRSRFLGEDYEPNTGAIADWLDRLVPPPDEDAPPEPARNGYPLDLGQGTRGSPKSATQDPLLRDLEHKLGLKH